VSAQSFRPRFRGGDVAAMTGRASIVADAAVVVDVVVVVVVTSAVGFLH